MYYASSFWLWDCILPTLLPFCILTRMQWIQLRGSFESFSTSESFSPHLHVSFGRLTTLYRFLVRMCVCVTTRKCCLNRLNWFVGITNTYLHTVCSCVCAFPCWFTAYICEYVLLPYLSVYCGLAARILNKLLALTLEYPGICGIYKILLGFLSTFVKSFPSDGIRIIIPVFKHIF